MQINGRLISTAKRGKEIKQHSKDQAAGHATERPRFEADHFQKHLDEYLLDTRLPNIS